MAKKEIYFDSFCGYIFCVIAENGKVEEFYFEKQQNECAVGNVYKGRVESVHPGMQAYFVDCGLEKNCFLSSEDILPDTERYGEEAPQPELNLKVGDELPVQILKLPVGKKGAKVSARLSFVGKCLIYMPESPFIGVSRKIADEELRHNLAYSAKRLKSADEGLVVRTAAPYAKRNQLKDEYSYLKNLYLGLKADFESAKIGDLLYADEALPTRIMRDTLSTDICGIYAGESALKDKLEHLVNLYPAQTRKTVTLHDSGRDMFEERGISEQIQSIVSPRVDLENGAYIIIEKTEALTVIDVNTGKFTGDYNLEQTVYHTNILAAREIARQVKLRNIGGIVVVDFIDMQEPAHNKSLVEELERALKKDKAKCAISPMSRFGLVEFTRKRMGASPLPLMIKPCRYCGEAGYTKTEEYILLGMRAKLLHFIADGAKHIRIDMNADVLARLTGWREFIGDLQTRGASVYAVPHRTYHEEKIVYRTDGDLPPDAVKIC